VANPESGLQTLINQGRLNDVEAQRLGNANQVATINTTSQDRREWDYAAQQINAGVKKENIHPSYHAAYDKVMASRPVTTGAGSPPIAAASSIDTYTAAPATNTSAATAPIAPAAIKNVAPAAAASAPKKENLSIGWREALPNSGYADPATGVVSLSEDSAVKFKPSVIDSYRPDQWRTLLAEIDSGRMTSAPLDEQLKARAYLVAKLNQEAARLKGLNLGY
jgi:hypothetical protein